MRELTETELGAVAGGYPMQHPSTTIRVGPGSFDGNALLNVQSQAGIGNGVGNGNVLSQSNNNNVSLSLGIGPPPPV